MQVAPPRSTLSSWGFSDARRLLLSRSRPAAGLARRRVAHTVWLVVARTCMAHPWEPAGVPVGEAIRRARFASAGEDQANRTNNHGIVVVLPPTLGFNT